MSVEFGDKGCTYLISSVGKSGTVKRCERDLSVENSGLRSLCDVGFNTTINVLYSITPYSDV